MQTGVAVGSVVSIGVTPLATGLFCAICWREKLSRRWYISTLIALFGLVLLFIANDLSIENLQGLIYAVISGFAYATTIMANKRLVKTHKPSALTMVTTSVAGLCMLPFAFNYSLAWIITPYGLIISLYFGIVTMAFTFALTAKGLQTTSASTASTSSLAEPLGGALLGIFFLREPLNIYSALGMACIFAALFWLMCPSPKQKTL